MSQVFTEDDDISLALQEVSMAEIMVKWMNDREVTAYLGRGQWPMTLKDEVTYLTQRYENHTDLTFGIVYKPDIKLVGSIGLHRIDNINQNAELGILIGEKEYWNKQIGRRAITLLCAHGFGRLNLRHIYLRVLGNNPRGQKCYEKCGFSETGRFPQYIFKDNVWHDEVFMLKVRS